MAAEASPDIYWAQSPHGGGAEHGSIARANLDGSGVNRDLISGTIGAGGVAVDARHIYWTNSETGTIGRATLDGSHVNERFISVAGVPEGMGVDSSRESGSTPAADAGCVPSEPPILLGSKLNAPGVYAAGWGEAAPVAISNGGVAASGTISEIHWSSWGGSVAPGRGVHPIYRPTGGYYPHPVTIELRASALRRCTPGGSFVYTRFSFREPSKPGGPVGKWRDWASNMCIRNGVFH